MKKSVVLLFGTLLTLSIIQPIQAGLTNAVYWDFSGGDGGASATSNSFSGLTVADLSRSNGGGATTPTLFATTSASTAYTTAAGFGNSGSFNAAASAVPGALSTSASSFFSTALTLGPASTFSLSISNVSLGSRSTASGPTSLSLYASTDDFVSDFESLGSITTSSNSIWTAVQFASLSLDVNPGETLSLRIYGSAGSGTSTSGNWRIDDLAIAMSELPVAVPEPTTLTLAGIGGITCLIAFRRRR